MVRFRFFEDKKTEKNDINVYFYDMDEEESVLMHVFAILTRKECINVCFYDIDLVCIPIVV